MRIMGLDVGDKTVGVAISDPFGLTSQGIKTIKIGEANDGIDELKALVSEYQIKTIVVGLPKNMNGTIGPQGEKVLSYVEKIKENVLEDVVLWDERLTTMAAKRLLIESNVRRENRKKVIDKIAATYILQGYLDSKGFKL